MGGVGSLVLGILNIIVCILLLLWYFNTAFKFGIRDAFTWPLPVLIAAMFALFGGVITLKKGLWGWAIASLITAVATSIYYVFLLMAVHWTMAW